MSYHEFSKSSISTVILTFRSTLVPYYLSKLFVVVETEEGGAYNIPMNVKMKIYTNNLHQDDSLLTCKATIPSIVNTLHKTIIPRDMYEKFVSKFYDDRRVEFYNLGFLRIQT